MKITVPAGSKKEDIDKIVKQEIESNADYMAMQESNARYDAPFDAQDNPTGTDHGTQNGQNATWPK